MYYDRANNFVLIIPDQLNHYMKDLFKESSHLIFQKVYWFKVDYMYYVFRLHCVQSITFFVICLFV
jgi:hypothetical protein